jgi:transposase
MRLRDHRPTGSPRHPASPVGSQPTRLHCRRSHAFNEALRSAAPKLKQAAKDVRAIADLLRQYDLTRLTPWLEASTATGLGGFVTGLRHDEPAVCAAIVAPRSDSPIEGQVNRLNPVKQTM